MTELWQISQPCPTLALSPPPVCQSVTILGNELLLQLKRERCSFVRPWSLTHTSEEGPTIECLLDGTSIRKDSIHKDGTSICKDGTSICMMVQAISGMENDAAMCLWPHKTQWLAFSSKQKHSVQ